MCYIPNDWKFLIYCYQELVVSSKLDEISTFYYHHFTDTYVFSVHIMNVLGEGYYRNE